MSHSTVAICNEDFIHPNEVPSHLKLSSGVFETVRIRFKDGDPYIIGLDLHITRLLDANQFIRNSQVTENKLKEGIGRAIGNIQSDTTDALLRIILLESNIYLTLAPWKPTLNTELGIAAVLFSGERPSPQNKWCAAKISIAARTFAEGHGAKEALLVDRNGIIREGAWSNFFWIDRNGTLITPENHILPGITRKIVIKEYGHVKFGDYTPEEIFDLSTECFISHATNGVVPVTSIDGNIVGKGHKGPITSKIQDLYAGSLRLERF